MDEVILIKIQGRTLDNLPDEYTEEQYVQEYSKQEKLVAIEEFRLERNRRLADVDKYALPDWPHASLAKQTEWLEYRQALRDLPSTTEDPANPVWPAQPTA